MNTWSSSNSSNKTQTGTLTWNQNGTLRQLHIDDSYNVNDHGLTCTYSYDDLTRLLGASCGSNSSQTFSYDYYGNIKKSGWITFNPVYNPNAPNNHADIFSYDGMGNVTNDVSHTYSYDAEGRPVSIDNGGTIIYYDAFGRAVTVNTNGTYTQILYDPNGGRFALMSGQSVQHYYLPLVAGVQAVYDGSGLKYYRHADWLGSSRLATTQAGGAVRLAYAPYGETYAEAGAADRSFTGQTQDVLAGPTGIYDFLFRQQASNQGRWMVPDPAGLAAVDITNPQTWNRYAYVTNDPCDQVDPLGLFSSNCQFNVAIDNQVGLSAGQISGIENRINSIFGATTGTNGESVGVKFGSGTADSTLTLTNMSPLTSLYFRIMTGPGTVYGAQSSLLSPRVYVNNIPFGGTDAIGGVGAHELGHEFTGIGDLPYSAQGANIFMFDTAPPFNPQGPSQTGALLNPNSPLWRFTPQQVSSLYKKCTTLHGGGGGGGGGGFISGGGFWNVGFYSSNPEVFIGVSYLSLFGNSPTRLQLLRP